ncbi:MAG: histidine phosphatase family protein, partial [Candidatus Limnocylindrales bacterium]
MIVLVRHGRTDANARGLLLGRADPVLDDEGRAQAARMAAALGPLDGARVVTSPLARCRQTAELIVAATDHEVPLDIDEAWIELDYGAFDGLGPGDVPADTWAAWRADVAWAPEGGESLAALGARVRSACGSLAEEARE